MLLTLFKPQSDVPVDHPATTDDCWGGAWGLSWGESWGSSSVMPAAASLGAWVPVEQRKKPRKRLDDDLEVEEALPDATVARLTKEMLAASMYADMADRARTRSRRMRAEEEALLLMI